MLKPDEINPKTIFQSLWMLFPLVSCAENQPVFHPLTPTPFVQRWRFLQQSADSAVVPKLELHPPWWRACSCESCGRKRHIALPVLQPGGANTADRAHQLFFVYGQGWGKTSCFHH
ncbi:hypothetical protein ATANTOWER_010558, partial [Ataeniobius toweri]|nr:hypothetical protein [Ataeniobius toweri]